MANELGEFSENYEESDAYTFETGAYELITKFSNRLFQGMVGETPKGENRKVKIVTTLGEIVVKKAIQCQQGQRVFKLAPVCRNMPVALGHDWFCQSSEKN